MLTTIQLSALEKVLPGTTPGGGYTHATALGGESFAYQLAVKAGGWGTFPAEIWVESPIAAHIRLYHIGHVPCGLAAYPGAADSDYLTTEPGLFPDPLFPIADGKTELNSFDFTLFWVEIKVPKGQKGGEYPITLRIKTEAEQGEAAFTLEVIEADLPPQTLLYTQWFHADCLAEQYGVEIWSDRHWALTQKYLKLAAEEGMNTVLTPVFTPALDTEPGGERPCTQLVKIKKQGEDFSFDFSMVERFMKTAEAAGITHFEISHLFTQWGAGFAPNIYAEEKGDKKRIFGWDTPADGREYRGLLARFLPEFTAFLEKTGRKDRAFFHISDEPSQEHLESYKKAKSAAEPYLEGYNICDALSEYEFYKMGLVKTPVAATNHIEPFLSEKVPKLWAYTCCAQGQKVGNRFLAMPSYRNRILGVQLYKYQIAGFLHWGYNFWYTQNSRRRIDPFRVTDAHMAFPGGDPFSVYPGEDGPVSSIRQKVFNHGLQDMRALQLLEKLGGEMPDLNGITFSQYPRSGEYLLSLREGINAAIKEACR